MEQQKSSLSNTYFSPGSNSIFTDHGPSSLLHAVQMARVFPDSKTFVDMKVTTPGGPNAALAAFEALVERHPASKSLPREEVARFVEQHFTMEEQMEEHEPEVRIVLYCPLPCRTSSEAAWPSGLRRWF